MILLVLFFLAFPSLALASVLSDIADAMIPDSWAVLNTTGIDTTTLLESGGNTGFITADASQGCYDMVAQKVHYIGMGHWDLPPPQGPRHVSYDLASNTWIREANPPFYSSSGVNHGWESTTCDMRGRMLYRMNINNLAIWRYNMATGVWTNLGAPAAGVASFPGFHGLAFHYERGTAGQLIIAGQEAGTTGVLYRWDPSLATYARISAGLLSGFPDSVSFAEYSDVHKVTMFGGNTTTARIMNTRGTLSATAAFPACVPRINRDGIIHADPATGNFVMLCGSSTASWHIYNPVTNVWITKPTPSTVTNHILNAASPGGTWPTWGKVGFPLPDHGVIMYVACRIGSCDVRLYKGGTFTATADRSFKRHCYAPGVTNCWGFDSANDITGNTASGWIRLASGTGSNATTAVLDTAIRQQGLSSLKFVVNSQTGADSAGGYADNFRDDMTGQVGQSSSFYIRWSQRYNCDWLYTSCPAGTGIRKHAVTTGSGGWKQFSFGTGDRTGFQSTSCNDLSTTFQNTDRLGFTQGYHHSCETTGLSLPFDENISGDIKLENARPLPYCRYTATQSPYDPNTNPFDGIYSNCIKYDIDSWVHYLVRVQTGLNVNNTFQNSRIEYWLAHDGDTVWTPVINVVRNLTNQMSPGVPGATYGKFFMFPYHTAKDSSQVHPAGIIHYDNVIVSSLLIPVPGVSGLPPIIVPGQGGSIIGGKAVFSGKVLIQ